MFKLLKGRAPFGITSYAEKFTYFREHPMSRISEKVGLHFEFDLFEIVW